MHGLAGLVEGVSFTLQNFDTSRTAKHRLREALLDGLRALEHVSIYGPHAPSPCTEVVSFNVDGMHPHDVAIVLENMAQIQLRAGLHCAPWIHRALGTADLGGTVRASIGPFNTLQHVERLIQAVAQLVR
jgi:selenocysteine lyase/cysteine desulfurase